MRIYHMTRLYPRTSIEISSPNYISVLLSNTEFPLVASMFQGMNLLLILHLHSNVLIHMQTLIIVCASTHNSLQCIGICIFATGELFLFEILKVTRVSFTH
jgi:hypothetical protein